MLALLGVASPGARGSGGTSAEHGRVLSAVADPPLSTEHWVLEDSSTDARECPAGRRGATEEECLAAVREAASRDGLPEVTGFKSVNDGAAGVVPTGCSYSLFTKMATFNMHAAGGYGAGSYYRLACRASAEPGPG